METRHFDNQLTFFPPLINHQTIALKRKIADFSKV